MNNATAPYLEAMVDGSFVEAINKYHSRLGQIDALLTER